jgi:hypothetical protein
MKRLMIAAIVVLCLSCAADAQAGCRPRGPRRPVATILERKPVRTFLSERQPLRRTVRAVGALLCGRSGGC